MMLHVFFSKRMAFCYFPNSKEHNIFLRLQKGQRFQAHIDIHISINVNSHSSVTEETEGVPFKKGLQRSERQEKKLKVRRE